MLKTQSRFPPSLTIRDVLSRSYVRAGFSVVRCTFSSPMRADFDYLLVHCNPYEITLFVSELDVYHVHDSRLSDSTSQRICKNVSMTSGIWYCVALSAFL